MRTGKLISFFFGRRLLPFGGSPPGKLIKFFFRPTPSWLPSGRYAFNRDTISQFGHFRTFLLGSFHSLRFCFCCLRRCFRWETQVWLGDLRVVAFGFGCCFCFVASIDLPFPRTFCPCLCIPCSLSCQNRASARHRPHSKKSSFHSLQRLCSCAMCKSL